MLEDAVSRELAPEADRRGETKEVASFKATTPATPAAAARIGVERGISSR